MRCYSINGRRRPARNGVLPLVLAIGLGVLAAWPLESAAGVDSQALRADVESLRPVSLTAAIQEFTGTLTQENIQRLVDAALKDIVRQGIDMKYPNFGYKPVVVLYEAPSEQKIIRMAVGVSVPPSVEVQEPLKIMQFDFKNAVRHVHIGPHQELEYVYLTTQKTVRGRAGWPVVLQILNNPFLVKPEQLRTVINIPVE